MDDRNFDSLTRALSEASPRRQLLRWVSGLLAGSVAGVVGLRVAAAESCRGNSDCTPPSNPCKKAVCKDRKCVNKARRKGTTCDDGDPCTENDQCNGQAVCRGTAKVCPKDGGEDQICCAGGSTSCTPGGCCRASGIKCTQDNQCCSGSCQGSGQKACV
jgi:hypothetical protein